MKSPLRSLGFLFLPFIWANGTLAGDASANPPDFLDLSGPWMSSFGPVTLKQDGSSVVGSFSEGSDRVRNAYMQGKTVPADQWNAESGTITDGVVDSTKKTLTFKYHEAKSQLNGDVAVTLSSDGGTLEGPYTATGMGGNRNGTWTMWRNKCGSAKYLAPC